MALWSVAQGPTQTTSAHLAPTHKRMTHPLTPHDSVYTGAQRSSQRGWGGLLAQPRPTSLSSLDESFIPLLAHSQSWHPEPGGGGKPQAWEGRRVQELSDSPQLPWAWVCREQQLL